MFNSTQRSSLGAFSMNDEIGWEAVKKRVRRSSASLFEAALKSNDEIRDVKRDVLNQNQMKLIVH